MKFRQNEFYAIEGNLLNLLNFEIENIETKNGFYSQGIKYPLTILNRVLTETIELDCQEKRCSFNKERKNDEKTK